MNYKKIIGETHGLFFPLDPRFTTCLEYNRYFGELLSNKIIHVNFYFFVLKTTKSRQPLCMTGP